MDTVYTKREDAGKALLGLLGMAMNRTEPVSIGRYKGFDLQIAYFAMDKMYLAYLVGSGINPVQLGADAVGNTVRLDNCLHNLPQSVTDLESKLVQLQKQLVAVKGTRGVRKKDMIHNALTPKIEVDPQNYRVRVDGELITCEPATSLPMAQRYFLF